MFRDLWMKAALLSVVVTLSSGGAWAGPVPIAQSMISVSYPTGGGTSMFMGNRNFNGAVPSHATILDPASNIKVFQAVDVFGRRASVALQYPSVLGADESLISHNFFKANIANDYFPGIVQGGNVTFDIANIKFAEPVRVDRDTMIFHLFWATAQSEQLDHFYHHVHNLHTLTPTLRDEHEFHKAHELIDPPHHVFGDMAPYISVLGDGTDTLRLMAAIPYDEFFKHLDEMGQIVPPGLPAPHGFLEPFHFHFEYVVSAVPEPASLSMLLVGGLLTARVRRRR